MAHSIDSLKQNAEELRGDRAKENPHFPGLPCADCDVIAIEGLYFCFEHRRADPSYDTHRAHYYEFEAERPKA